MSEVVISAIHNETINKYQRIQRAANLDVGVFEIEIFSSIRSVIGREMSPILILDIGAGTTKLAMVEYGIVKSYHIINRGSQDVTTALAKSMEIDVEKAEIMKRDAGIKGEREAKRAMEVARLPFDYIFSEAESATMNFERRTGKRIKKVILTGGGALMKGLADLAEGSFDREVVMGNPFERVETPAFLDEALARTGPEFAVSLGIALKGLQDNP